MLDADCCYDGGSMRNDGCTAPVVSMSMRGWWVERRRELRMQGRVTPKISFSCGGSDEDQGKGIEL